MDGSPPAHRALTQRGAALLLAALLCVAGCGRKGPPLVPLVRVPAPVGDLTVRRLGNDVYLTFTIPAQNVDGSVPADVTHVELLAHTAAAAPALPEFRKRADRVAVVPVGARSDAREPGESSTAAPGQRVTLRETLTPASDSDVPSSSRYYLALAFGPRDRPSPGGRLVGIPVSPGPAAPAAPDITFSAESIVVTWPEQPEAAGYRVYRTDAAGSDSRAEPPQPLNATALDATRYAEPVSFGEQRCYLVRSLSGGDVPVEGEASPPACITPEDIFPPSAPAELTAIAGPDGIAVRWSPSPEPDVAGYLVLRGTTADDTLLPITDVPVVEPRFLDRDVVAGVRYVYAVVAVDGRRPTPNRSPESPRDAVTAR